MSGVECECLAECPFFHDRMKHMPSTAEVLKHQFCLGAWESCARCTVYRELGREGVPPDLFPDEMDRARELLDLRAG